MPELRPLPQLQSPSSKFQRWKARPFLQIRYGKARPLLRIRYGSFQSLSFSNQLQTLGTPSTLKARPRLQLRYGRFPTLSDFSVSAFQFPLFVSIPKP